MQQKKDQSSTKDQRNIETREPAQQQPKNQANGEDEMETVENEEEPALDEEDLEENDLSDEEADDIEWEEEDEEKEDETK